MPKPEDILPGGLTYSGYQKLIADVVTVISNNKKTFDTYTNTQLNVENEKRMKKSTGKTEQDSSQKTTTSENVDVNKTNAITNFMIALYELDQESNGTKRPDDSPINQEDIKKLEDLFKLAIRARDASYEKQKKQPSSLLTKLTTFGHGEPKSKRQGVMDDVLKVLDVPLSEIRNDRDAQANIQKLIDDNAPRPKR